MNTPMAAAMKVMVDPNPGPHDVTDKITVTITMTLNQNDQTTMAVVEGNRQNTTTPPATVGEVGHAQRIRIKLVVMICGDRIGAVGINIWLGFFFKWLCA